MGVPSVECTHRPKRVSYQKCLVVDNTVNKAFVLVLCVCVCVCLITNNFISK